MKEQGMPLIGTHPALPAQRDADYQVLLAERVKEADWLEVFTKDFATELPILAQERIYNRLAQLREIANA